MVGVYDYSQIMAFTDLKAGDVEQPGAEYRRQNGQATVWKRDMAACLNKQTVDK
jgi:hypothetical protein